MACNSQCLLVNGSLRHDLMVEEMGPECQKKCHSLLVSISYFIFGSPWHVGLYPPVSFPCSDS